MVISTLWKMQKSVYFIEKILSQDDSNCDKTINNEYEGGKNNMFDEIKNLLKM